jgi:predicted RNase H-like HicB family nuclease
MPKKFYPAILERGPKGSFAVWFPDFPDIAAGGKSQDDALEKAELALARLADAMAEASQPLPDPTAFDKIRVAKDCRPIAFFAVGVEPPNPSERVNIYLPKNLIARADKRAAELGMSRSSFFGLAISRLTGWSYNEAVSLTLPRSKIHRTAARSTSKKQPR